MLSEDHGADSLAEITRITVDVAARALGTHLEIEERTRTRMIFRGHSYLLVARWATWDDAVAHSMKRQSNQVRATLGSVPAAKDTKEQQCVADADAIVHMRTLPALFFVAYSKLEMDIDAGKDWGKEKIERDWQKLSDVGRQTARGLYESCRTLLE